MSNQLTIENVVIVGTACAGLTAAIEMVWNSVPEEIEAERWLVENEFTGGQNESQPELTAVTT